MTDGLIHVRDLDFRHGPDEAWRLRCERWQLGSFERHLLVGANGAGKTTFLRILAGAHLVAPEVVQILGRPAFHDTSLVRDVCFLGGSPPFDVDVSVADMLARRPDVSPERREQLVRLLGVEPGWRLHRLSDGQRRRVRILLKLLRPARVLLLDEVTSDLDVVARADLLAFLRAETERHGAGVVYATHVFDGLDDWATHLTWIAGGRLQVSAPLAGLPEWQQLRAAGVASPLHRLVEGWLRGAARPSGLSPAEAP